MRPIPEGQDPRSRRGGFLEKFRHRVSKDQSAKEFRCDTGHILSDFIPTDGTVALPGP